MHYIDSFAADQVYQPACIGVDAQGIERIGRHRQKFAADGGQFVDQRPVFAGHHRARAGLQQRARDIDRGTAYGIVAQRRHELQDRGAGEQSLRRGRAHGCIAPLARGAGLRREGARTDIAFILEWT